MEQGNRKEIQRDQETRLVVYDLLGRQVATLVDEASGTGSYEVAFTRQRKSRDGGHLAFDGRFDIL